MGGRKVWVISIDKQGNELADGKWEDVPAADEFANAGIDHIEKYVTKLLQSSKRFSSLIVATPNEQFGVGIWKRKDIVNLSVSIDWRNEPTLEFAIRKFMDSQIGRAHV